NCDYAVQKLLEKDLVIISGRNEDAVGKPLIYATSKSFMDYFGINSAQDLPKISEVMMEELVKATTIQQAEEGTEEVAISEETIEVVNEDEKTTEDITVLSVTQNGDIIEEVNEDNSDNEAPQA
ncbi:MAG TPA: SMC-Scp complex subunit ScpB, partial [Ferruginibacter sp.]|nr:SMC-Scp complex subunit ScpB [Ferruginibacter sp.]